MHFKDSSRTIKLLATACIATFTSLLIAGCGSSGSGGVSAVSYTLPATNSTPLAISSTNQTTLAASTANSGVFALNAGAGGVTGVSTGGGTTVIKQPLFDTINMANKIVANSLAGNGTAMGATQSVSCASSGNISITYDASGDFLMQFNSCDNGISTTNGGMAATGVSHSGTPPTAPFSISLNYSYNLSFVDDSTAATVAEMGSFDIAWGDNGSGVLTLTISNGSMGATTGSSSFVMSNFSETRSCSSYDTSTYACLGDMSVYGGYTLADSTGSLTVSISSSTPMIVAYGAMYPYSGTINVSGSGGSYLTITASNDDLNTTGNPVAVTVTWAPDSVTSPTTTTYASWTSI